jgi:WD40 repeat protein
MSANGDLGGEQNDKRVLCGAHGIGFSSISWCQIGGEDGSRPVWHAVTAGQDGKLVLRNGDEGLGVVKISGDHEKPAADLAVTPDGKSVVVIDDQYVQVRVARASLSAVIAHARPYRGHAMQAMALQRSTCGVSLINPTCQGSTFESDPRGLVRTVTLSTSFARPRARPRRSRRRRRRFHLQIYCTPDLDLLTSACRFTLPGRSVAVGGRDGDVLAAGGDDGLLKLVRISEGKVRRGARTAGRRASSCALDHCRLAWRSPALTS